jgi:hypothetical protein
MRTLAASRKETLYLKNMSEKHDTAKPETLVPLDAFWKLGKFIMKSITGFAEMFFPPEK